MLTGCRGNEPNRKGEPRKGGMSHGNGCIDGNAGGQAAGRSMPCRNGHSDSNGETRRALGKKGRTGQRDISGVRPLLLSVSPLANNRGDAPPPRVVASSYFVFFSRLFFCHATFPSRQPIKMVPHGSLITGISDIDAVPTLPTAPGHDRPAVRARRVTTAPQSEQSALTSILADTDEWKSSVPFRRSRCFFFLPPFSLLAIARPSHICTGLIPAADIGRAAGSPRDPPLLSPTVIPLSVDLVVFFFPSSRRLKVGEGARQKGVERHERRGEIGAADVSAVRQRTAALSKLPVASSGGTGVDGRHAA